MISALVTLVYLPLNLPPFLPIIAKAHLQTSNTQTNTDRPLDLVDQTIYIEDEPAYFELAVNAPTSALVRVRTYNVRNTVAEVRASYNSINNEPPISDFVCAINDPQADGPCQINDEGNYLIVMPDDEIGELLRAREGALVVNISVETSSGATIDSLTTHLVVLRQQSLERQTAATLYVAFLADLTEPLATNTDQTINLNTESLLSRAERIANHPEIPISVALQPETLQALASLNNEQLAALTTHLADRPILNNPWVDLDEEAWRRSGDTNFMAEQYQQGALVINESLGRAPIGVSQLDSSANAHTLEVLRQNGSHAVIVSSDQINIDQIGTPNNNQASDTLASTVENTFAPWQLRDASGLPMPAITINKTLQENLTHPDHELAAHKTITELAISANSGHTNQAVLFDFDAIHPTTLNKLLDGIGASPNIELSSLMQVLNVPVVTDTNGRPHTANLRSTTARDVGQRAADIAATQGTIRAYASMVAPSTNPIRPLETLIWAAAASNLTDQQSSVYTQTAFETALAGTENITVEGSDRITLTERQATLVLTVHNGQPLPLNVELLFSAEKLRFLGGERVTRTLQPGDNELMLEVEALASGDARITVDIISPDGKLELVTGVLDIRATAISGLGVVISVIALAVLGSWWVQTIWRVRRNRASAIVKETTTTETTIPKP